MLAIFTRLRNLIVTGFIFIMPLLITVVILARFWKHLLKVGGGVSRLLRIDTVLGPSGDAVIAVVFFLSICFVAGLLIRISFLRRVSERIDRRLNELIPGYSQIRLEATKKIGVGSDEGPHFDACLVTAQELSQPGYIIEQNLDGTRTVFVPQAPTFATGQVYVVEPSRIKKLDIDAAALNAHLQKLGKGIVSHMA
ncbi:MAG: hypothetical protein ACXWC0_28025 [Burkholderiales bacterium]